MITANMLHLGVSAAGKVDNPVLIKLKGDPPPVQPAAFPLDKTHQRQGGDRLAGTGLSDDRQRFTGEEIKGEIVDRGRGPGSRTKRDRQVLDREQRGSGSFGHHRTYSAACWIWRSLISGCSWNGGSGSIQRRAVSFASNETRMESSPKTVQSILSESSRSA